jgi:hypothetical protein
MMRQQIAAAFGTEPDSKQPPLARRNADPLRRVYGTGGRLPAVPEDRF